jgi:hypothetical protein
MPARAARPAAAPAEDAVMDGLSRTILDAMSAPIARPVFIMRHYGLYCVGMERFSESAEARQEMRSCGRPKSSAPAAPI